MKDFKAFLLRGNLVDMAVGIVIGVAFGAVIAAFVADIVTPLIAAIFGKPSYGDLVLTVHKSHILYGLFINAVISFLLIAIGVYFFIVAPMNYFERARRRRRGLPETVPEVTEIELLTQIRDSLATRE